MSIGPMHIVKQSNNIASAAVVFLHGSGDTGQGVLNWIQFLVGNFSFPHIQFYFPTAPLRPYTPLQGELSNVWFDRYNITPEVPEHVETLNSIGNEMKNLVETIEKSGTPRQRIMIGGFSMGGALALHCAFRFTPGLAGVFTLSSFLNNNSIVYSEFDRKSQSTPLYMCHGERDDLVPILWGQKTFNDLKGLDIGLNAEFIPIKNTMHELKKMEIEGLFKWIHKVLPPLESDKS